MPQQQCPWCGHCGPRYPDGTPYGERPSAHSDGSTCVCRHITTNSPESAYEHGGRYYDHLAGRWICLAGCHPEIAAPVIRELDTACEDLEWHMPPGHADLPVIVSYAYDGERYYRRECDTTDGEISTYWAPPEALEGEWEPWADPPALDDRYWVSVDRGCLAARKGVGAAL